MGATAELASRRFRRGRAAAFVLAAAVLPTGAALAAVPRYSPSRTGPLVPVLVGKTSPSDRLPEDTVVRLGGRVERPLGIIDGFRADVPASAVPYIRALGDVRFVAPDPMVHLQSQMGQDSGTASAVYTDSTRASKAWGMGVTGKGVNVALIDTGVNTSGDLSGKVVHAVDFTSEDNNQDTFGHGTFVAGLIAGSGTASSGAVMGMAPGAGIVSEKIAGANGATDVTMILEALEWTVDHKDAYDIRVVNLSLGFNSSQSYLTDPLDFAVERVWHAGIVVVVAAGNGGNSPGTITAPGNDPYVLTVGASDDRTTVPINDDAVAPFSSSGPTVPDGLTKPDLVAPGKSVISSRSPGSTVDTLNPASEIAPSYARGSGTSFSTGITSGAAALVISRTWSLTPDQVKNRLVSTARVLSSGVTPATGTGTLDAFAATFSQDLTPANTGALPSAGTGSLQASRGAACITDSSGACLSDGDANALLGFDPISYFSGSWAGSQWVGSQWMGTALAGSQWTGTQWAGTQWAGSQWVDSTWADDQWAGSQWTGSQWAGSQWLASQWSSSQWAAAQGPWAGWEN